MAAAGLLCFVTRAWPRLHRAHAWLGRIYILSVLWCMAFSLIIHNTGLPIATLVSFLWVLLSVSFGWFIAIWHTNSMTRRATAAVAARLAKGEAVPDGPDGLARLIAAERAALAQNKTFARRFFSLKAAHGVMMFVGWINVVGRVFATPGLAEFTCYTYRECSTTIFMCDCRLHYVSQSKRRRRRRWGLRLSPHSQQLHQLLLPSQHKKHPSHSPCPKTHNNTTTT